MARTVADPAGVGAGDRVVDPDCGPGTAVREAARRGGTVIRAGLAGKIIEQTDAPPGVALPRRT